MIISRDDYLLVQVLEVKRDVQRLLVGMKTDSSVAESRMKEVFLLFQKASSLVYFLCPV